MNTVIESTRTTRSRDWDIERVRRDFPILNQKTRSGKPLAYLDNAATAQKPQSVIAAMERFYSPAGSDCCATRRS